MFKSILKWTNSEPLQNRFLNKHDCGDVAHLGSKNVVLMGYHPINEPPVRKKFADGIKHTSTVTINNNNNNHNAFM